MQRVNRQLLLFAVFACAACAQLRPIPNDLKVAGGGASTCAFKTTPQGDLAIHLYFPKDWRPRDRRPAIVLFFGGGFTNGSPAQFQHTAQYFASRGMVAATPEYRIRTKHSTSPDKSIEDAKSAIRWLRTGAARLGIDSGRLVAGGGSSGGTCAALAALNDTLEDKNDDRSISCIPNVLVLFNPAVGFGSGRVTVPPAQREVVSQTISAWTVKKGSPPAILFYGTEDALMEKGREMVAKYLALGNRAELYTAAGQKHGFFNEPGLGAGVAPWHELVMYKTDEFLASLGYLEGKPTIQLPAGDKAALQKELP